MIDKFIVLIRNSWFINACNKVDIDVIQDAGKIAVMLNNLTIDKQKLFLQEMTGQEALSGFTARRELTEDFGRYVDCILFMLTYPS